MKSTLKWLGASLAFVGALVLGGCTKQDESASASRPQGQSVSQTEFKILAGSELKDVADQVVAFGQSKGVAVKFTYTGSLDAVDTLSEPHGFDAVWLSHGKYLQLSPQVRPQVKTSEKTMYSRVVMGVKPAKAHELGWDKSGGAEVTWKQVIAAVKSGKLKLAMTNPAGSNTGFVTLVGVASELSGKGDALQEADIPEAALKELFSGVTLTSGSSGDLAERFKANPDKADAIVNYEATIRSMSQQVPMQVVIPKEGVITADYPLMLLTTSKNQAFYDELVAYLRSDAAQEQIAKSTMRTPLKGAGADDAVVNELPFPGSVKVVDAILRGYLDSYSKPAVSYFVLDKSGSMHGQRMTDLKAAMSQLVQGDGTVSGRFSTFRNREVVYVTAFNNVVAPAEMFELGSDATKNKEVLSRLDQSVQALTPQDGTAVYDALYSVYAQAQAQLKAGNKTVSIVLLTDGENNNGIGLRQFLAHVSEQGEPKVPVFAILYGEGNVDEMKSTASATGGRTFDARAQSLKSVMKAIRAYQ